MPGGTHLVGEQARKREDAASGTAHYVAGQLECALCASTGCPCIACDAPNETRVDTSATQIVDKALRRSVADAYAAYIGQTNGLPSDDYGLALFALDKAYWPQVGLPSGTTTGRHTFNLTNSPFCNSKAKHAAIGNAARKIMQNLDAYVHEVASIAPGKLNQLAGRLPVYDDKGNEIAWSPEIAAHIALHGRPPKGNNAAHKLSKGEGGGDVPYPPACVQSPRKKRTDSAPSPHQAIRGALVGTAHKPDPMISSALLTAKQAGHTHSPSKGASWQAKTYKEGDLEGACADAAMRVVSAAAAERTRQRDTVATQKRRQVDLMNTPEKRQEQQRIAALAKAQAPPPFIKLPPHMRVSGYYSHIRPPAPLHDWHVNLLPHAAQSPPPQPAYTQSSPLSDPAHTSAQPPAQMSEISEQTLPPMQSQQTQQTHQPQPQQPEGVKGSPEVTEGAAAAQQASTANSASSSVARALGIHDLDDQQLLEAIQLYRQTVLGGAADGTTTDGKAHLNAGDLPDSLKAPPLPGTGLFNACNANRSRRLSPSNVELHNMRMSAAGSGMLKQ